VSEFVEQVGAFTLKRVNLELGSWPFDEAPAFDPSELLAPEPVAPDSTVLVPDQKPVVWN
jgi:hypothetical protein